MVVSAYEKERERNIAANKKVLEALGLEKCVPSPPASKKIAVKRERQQVVVPTRKSSRRLTSSEGSVASATIPAVETLADIPAWHLDVFKECEEAGGSSSVMWDPAKHHQHLTRSKGGRSVATTGVAGYGAAIAKRTPNCRRWAIRAVRFGIGGFAIGLVRSGMRPPFKSIGRSADAIAVYHCSGQLEGGGKAPRAFGSGYDEGDLIEMALRPAAKGKAHDAVLLRNGEEVGVAARGLAADTVLLAVQPYMGGVAMLEGIVR